MVDARKKTAQLSSVRAGDEKSLIKHRGIVTENSMKCNLEAENNLIKSEPIKKDTIKDMDPDLLEMLRQFAPVLFKNEFDK